MSLRIVRLFDCSIVRLFGFGGQFLHRNLRLRGGLAVGRAEDGLHVARLEAVGEVMHHQLVRRGDDHGAELVAREDREPELVVALQDEHHLVAAADAERGEVVRGAVRLLRHLAERDAPLGEVVRNVQHRKLVRRAPGDLVDDVEGEVEPLRMAEADVQEASVGVLDRIDEPLDDQRLLGELGADGLDGDRLLLLAAGHDHRDERDVLAADGDHAVGRRGLVEDRVALVEDLLVVADAHAHRSAHNEVELLPRVGRRMDRQALQLLVVAVGDVIGRRQAVAEHRRHVADLDALLLRGDRALAAARHEIARQLRRVALEQRVDVDAEGERALVEEGEGRIALPGLDGLVLGGGDVREARHLTDRITADRTHLADTRGHFLQRIARYACIHLLSTDFDI